MRRAQRIVAAALGGGIAILAVAALALAALALGAGDTTSALVTLQVAPRGPGSVTAVPKSLNDPDPCTKQDGNQACQWSYERGTTVVLTAAGDGPGQFVTWSETECGTSNPCTVKVDDDVTSVAAQFTPLMLAVTFSRFGTGATVSFDPAGQECDDPPDDPKFCRAYAPHTRVTLTLKPGSEPFTRWSERANYLCEPVTSPTCTIAVEDQPTWAGARLGGDDDFNLAPTISVEFKLRKTGNGKGRVTASKLDCGTVCSANFGFGKPIALTATAEEGSTFDGWNGVCAKTQTTCTFAAGPITSIRAAFTRDAIAPSMPGAVVVGARTRTSVALSWAAATDNVKVTGYRVYLNDATAGDTQATAYTLQGLKCGRSYAVAVDAVDALGNRSPRASGTAQTRPCALVARLAGVGVARAGAGRMVVVTLRVNRPTTARLRLLRGGRALVSGRFRVSTGSNRLRLRVPRSLPRGSYRLAIVLANPDGGSLVLAGRGVLLPRP